LSNGGGNDSGQHYPLGDAYADASTPDKFTAWIRDRTTGARCDLTIHGAPATITSASTNTTAIDATGELRCWKQLRAAVQTALNGDTETAAAMLPPEIAAAEWVHHGKRTRIHQPGAATRALRCARRGLKALTPIPVLGALSQPLAGGATAVGILLAPIPLPSPDEPPPFSMAVPGRTLHGEIDRPAPGSVADAHPATTPAVGPGAPLFPALLPRAPLFPAAGDSTEKDVAPTPVPVYTPPPATLRTAPPLAPTPPSTPTLTPTPSAAPTPTTTGILDETSPSPTPTDTGTPEPTVSPSPVVTQSLKHLPHRRHHKHLLRRGLRHW